MVQEMYFLNTIYGELEIVLPYTFQVDRILALQEILKNADLRI